MAAKPRRRGRASPTSPPPDLFQAVECQRFGASTCFLCGRRLGSRNRADEHVIPAWLQARHDLWNEHLVLLNHTSIPYRRLTIPACRTCNTDRFGPVEQRVADAMAADAQAVAALDRMDLFLWLGKIFYGLIYKEGFLKRQRARTRSGPIAPRPLLENFAMHHYFLQAARLPIRFVDCFPASIFVFEVQEPADPRFRFDFRDHTPSLAISIRAGRVGIIAALQDGGAQQELAREHFEAIQKVALHPLQFQEVTASFFYTSARFNRTPKFLIGDRGHQLDVHILPLGGLSLKPVFDNWEPEVYAHVLSVHTGAPLDVVFAPPDQVMSWIRNDTAAVNFMDIGKHPWPPGWVGGV